MVLVVVDSVVEVVLDIVVDVVLDFVVEVVIDLVVDAIVVVLKVVDVLAAETGVEVVPMASVAGSSG